jgi:decaprenyl-phosphate phosphoribosyltransferase
MNIRSYIQLIRPKHWVKNIVVLLPVIFGLQYQQIDSWITAALTAILFCVVSSLVYVINDIVDAESDRHHPSKKNRPIASATISKKAAAVGAILLLLLAVLLTSLVSRMVALAALAYLLLQLGYIFCLKYITLLDVICISLGFVIRAAAGAIAVKVFISPWLFICMFTIFLFMGFCKRFNEVAVFSDESQLGTHRKTLIAYNPSLLIYLITTSSAVAIVAFLSYSLSASTIERFGTAYFVYTLPFVCYAIFRFAMLSMKGVYCGPTEIICGDRPFQITVFLWGCTILFIIVYGLRLQEYLRELY